MGELGLTRDGLAQKTGLDKKTIYNLLSAIRWPQPKTRAVIEKALGWYSGDLQRIAKGGEPIEYQPPPTGRELLADAMRQRRHELDLDWSDIARDAGITTSELARLRRSLDPTPEQARGLDRALRWEPGSVHALLSKGRLPVTLEDWRKATTDDSSVEKVDPVEARIRALEARVAANEAEVAQLRAENAALRTERSETA